MKKTLALILAVIMVLTVIAGCAPTATDPDKEPNDPVSENTPQAGDITPVADGTICTVSPNSDVVLLNYSDISTFCPPNYTQAAEYVPGSLAYESLCDFDDNMNIRWVLATGVDISDDNLEYTFSLREGITFSDGTPWNAEALKANFDLMLDAEQAFLGVWLFEPVDHCEVVDEYTAKLVLKNTCASLLNILAAYGGFMSPALIEQGPEAWKNNVVGTGQYTLTEYRSGESMTFSLNRNYWGYDPEICGGTAMVEPDAGFNTITIKPVAEEATRIAMLLSGEADIVNSLSATNVATVEGNGKTVFKTIGSMVGYLYMNCQSAALSDVRIRQAIAKAIDCDALNQVVYGGLNQTCDSVIPPCISFYERQGDMTVDIEGAKALMAEAGYPNGGLTLVAWEENDTTDIQRGEFIQQQLAQIGITLEVYPMEGGILATEVGSYEGGPENQGYDIYIRGWTTDTFDPDEMLGRYMTKNFAPNGANYSYYSNAEYDALCEQGASTIDPAVREEAYSKAQKIIWEEKPVLPLLVNGFIGAYGSRIANFGYKSTGGLDFKTAKFAD
jgi:glutathione transport system substrate-binding protein